MSKQSSFLRSSWAHTVRTIGWIFEHADTGVIRRRWWNRPEPFSTCQNQQYALRVRGKREEEHCPIIPEISRVKGVSTLFIISICVETERPFSVCWPSCGCRTTGRPRQTVACSKKKGPNNRQASSWKTAFVSSKDWAVHVASQLVVDRMLPFYERRWI